MITEKGQTPSGGDTLTTTLFDAWGLPTDDWALAASGEIVESLDGTVVARTYIGTIADDEQDLTVTAPERVLP
jgi:hypothetical protein